MSVVSLVICDDFSLILGDTKLSDNPNKNITKKVFKKDDILLGYTGTLKEIGEYLHPILTRDYVPNEKYTWGTPTDFFNFLDDKFYNAIENNIEKDIIFVVSAKIGKKYISKYYCLLNSNGYAWKTETLISDDHIRFFYLGDKSHKVYFKQKINDTLSVSRETLINIFQDTLNYGVEYDNTINDRMECEYI